MQPWACGQIVLLHCSWLGKDKFFIYLGDSEDSEPLFFYISSEPYRMARNNPELMAQQVQIFKNQHACLSHNSWANCAEVCTQFSWREVDSLCNSQAGKAVGIICKDLKTKIQKIVSLSTTLSTYEQRIICQNLIDQ